MAVFTLEDLESAIECMVFPKTMQECGHVLRDDALVTVRARVQGLDRSLEDAARRLGSSSRRPRGVSMCDGE